MGSPGEATPAQESGHSGPEGDGQRAPPTPFSLASYDSGVHPPRTVETPDTPPPLPGRPKRGSRRSSGGSCSPGGHPRRRSMNSRMSFWKSSEHDHPVVQELQVIQERLMHDQQQSHHYWINSASGNMFFGVLILLNSAFIGVDIELYGDTDISPVHMMVIESLFLISFWVEIALRLRANGAAAFCYDRWGPFDVLCTLLGSVDVWLVTPLLGSNSALNGFAVLRTLRLLRLLRLLRVFRTFAGLARLATILANSMQAMLWLGILLIIFIYISSVFVFTLLKDEADAELARATQNILFAMYHHLMLLTGEGFTKVWVNPTWRISGWWLFYWVACVIWLNVFMLNLMVGVLVQQTLGSKKQEEEALANLAVESAQFHETLRTLFATNDINADGLLNAKELNDLLDGKDLVKILKTFNVKCDVPRTFLFQVFDLTHDNEITFMDFYEACVRLCGSSHDVRSFMLQVDVARLKQDISHHVDDVRRALPGVAASMSEPRPPRPAEPGANLRALVLEAHKRMETLEKQQDALLEALTALRDSPAA